MKTTTFRSFAAELEEAADTGMRFLRRGLRTFSALPWPALLLAVFLAIKYAVLAINKDKTTPLGD
jgi:hypothetical protein